MKSEAKREKNRTGSRPDKRGFFGTSKTTSNIFSTLARPLFARRRRSRGLATASFHPLRHFFIIRDFMLTIIHTE